MAVMAGKDKTGTLIEILRNKVDSGDYSAGDAIPSERLLMEEFAVSRTTVRRAIDALTAEGRLLRRAGAGTYVSDIVGDAGRQQMGLPTVGFVIPTFADPLYGEMINGIEQEARRQNLRVLAAQSDYLREAENNCLGGYASDPAVHGVILVPSSIGDITPGIRQFLKTRKPMVFLGRWPTGVAADCISSNYAMGGVLAVSHLLELGHSQIAYVEGTPHLPGFSPYDGYCQALARGGLHLDPALIKFVDLPAEEAGFAAVQSLLSAGAPFTSILARNDATALGACRALKQAGIGIPQQVSVASVNNSQLAQHLDPPLTSVDPSSVLLGREAFRLLRDRMDRLYEGPNRRILLDPKLVVRASTAATSALATKRLV